MSLVHVVREIRQFFIRVRALCRFIGLISGSTNRKPGSAGEQFNISQQPILRVLRGTRDRSAKIDRLIQYKKHGKSPVPSTKPVIAVLYIYKRRASRDPEAPLHVSVLTVFTG
jgi:hypothetical protein